MTVLILTRVCIQKTECCKEGAAVECGKLSIISNGKISETLHYFKLSLFRKAKPESANRWAVYVN